MNPTDSKAAVRQYFDADVDDYRGAYSSATHDDARRTGFLERRDLVLAMLSSGVRRVIDIGAGPGVFSARLLDRGASVWTVDLSFAMIAAGRQSLGGGRAGAFFAVGDIDRLPFQDGSFDTALCVGVLQYLDSLDAAFGELARVTRPGGQVVITFPNAASPLNRLHALAVGIARDVRRVAEAVNLVGRADPLRLTFRSDIPNRWFTAAELERIAHRVGLERQALQYHVLQFPFDVPGLRWAIRAWNRLAARRSARAAVGAWGREGIMRLVRP